MTFKQYVEEQRDEILGKDNMHYTRESLRRKGIEREPTSEEAALHYISNGGAAHFRQKCGHLLNKE